MKNSSNLSSSNSVETFVTKMSQNDFQNEEENKVRSVTVDDKILTGQEMIDFLVKVHNVKGKVDYFAIVNGELEAVGCCQDCVNYRRQEAEIRTVRKPTKTQDFLLPRKFKTQNISSSSTIGEGENSENSQGMRKQKGQKSVKANKFQRRFKKTKRNVRI